MWGAGFMF
uniref:Uncharacterized protein n=1 Tax=Anguilla anguilla TaxID=7936 RepID=A0A0E9PR54_ANGAN